MAVRPPTRPAGQVPPAALPPLEPLRALLAPVVAEAGAVLEDVEVTRAGRRAVVTVLVDGEDDRLDLDEVAIVSRQVSDALDAAPTTLLPAAYTLEVSSPGVDRPLTELRHWRRNVGRLVTAQLHGAPTVTGRIVEVGAAAVTLEVAGIKGRKGHQAQITLTDVAKAVVQVDFNRVAEADLGDDLPDGPDSDQEDEDEVTL
jgi:ribosome maturation factor RimP